MSSIEEIRNIKIIQGGMGAGVSDDELAGVVSRLGQLGVVSETAANILLTRGLQRGDPSGKLREALVAFPNKEIAERIYNRYFIDGGKRQDKDYIPSPFPTFDRSGEEIRLRNTNLEDELVVGAFAQVYLAKRGHYNPVGANFLNKLEWAQLPTLFGAMLAGVNVALIGAGLPRDIPKVLDEFSQGRVGKMAISFGGKDYHLTFDPERYGVREVNRPVFLGIVGSHLGFRGMSNADGYVFEGFEGGGHNAPARSGKLTEIGEPVYDFGADNVDFNKLGRLNDRPFWLAGNYATRLGEARSHDAAGVQVGTPFAFCKESATLAGLKQIAIDYILRGGKVFTNPDASSSGFPFKELCVPGTIGDKECYLRRLRRRCDLGYLAELYEDAGGEIRTRCPAEPAESYAGKGGKPEATRGRKCLCRGLAAVIGLGTEGELPLLTSGSNLTAVKEIVAQHGREYSAENVINYILEKAGQA
jgi:nitronate monooxygenase